jgi:DNA-binding transcriptional LysR family regulator
MDWDDLRVFLAVSREHRVSAAAKKLGVEHTTVARRLAALERDLGVRLFYRTPAGYGLTPEGGRMLGSAETMERAALAIGARARDVGPIAGRVRIAMLEEMATYWLAPLLPKLHAKHPELEVEVIAGIPPLDIARGEAELAVRLPRPRQSGLAARRLGRTSTALYATKAVAKKQRRVDADTRGLDLLVYSAAYHALQAAAWFQPVLASSRIVLASNSTAMIAAAARAGAGIAVAPGFVAHAFPELVAISDDLMTGEFWLVTHPEYRRDPRVRAVADFLVSVAQGLA